MEIQTTNFDAEQVWNLESHYSLSPENSLTSSHVELHQIIFSPPSHPLFSHRHNFNATNIFRADKSMAACANQMKLKARSSGSGEIYIEYKDDGKGNGEWVAGGKGEWHDDDGNYIKGGGEISSDGSSNYYGGAGKRKE